MRFQTLFEGRLFFIIFVALLLLSGIFHWSFLGFLGLLGLIFCVNFFRDPDRTVPTTPGIAVSPADGKVMIGGAFSSVNGTSRTGIAPT